MFTFLKVSLLLMASFLLRPSALGQSFSDLGIILCVLTFFIHFIEFSKARKLDITKHNAYFMLSIMIMWVYLFSHSGFNTSVHFDFTVKATISNILVLISAAITLSLKKARDIFFKSFITVLALLAGSYLITVLISIATGFERLYMFTLPVQGYEDQGVGKVYFPFTVIYSFMGSGGFEFPRLLGLFREAGIYQAFLVWGIFSVKYFDFKKPKLIMFLLFSGVISTFSTAGLGVLLATYALKLLLDRKIFKTIFITVIAYISVFYAPFIGLNSKSVTHSTSITDRTDATINGLRYLAENPLGIGLYNELGFEAANSGINLLANSYTIGVIGLVLVFLVFITPMFTYKLKKGYIVSVFPIFITMLLSQPILDAPMVYLILLADYGMIKERVILLEKSMKRKRSRIALPRITLN